MIVNVDQLVDYMSNIELDEDQRTAAEEIIAGVQGEVENFLNRPIEVAEATETLTDDGTGVLWPKRTPVVSIGSVMFAGTAIDASLFSVNGNGITTRAYLHGPVQMTYRGGLDGKNIREIRLCVLRVASRELQNRHDDTLSAKDLDANDVAPLPEGLQPEDERRIERWRRRTIA